MDDSKVSTASDASAFSFMLVDKLSRYESIECRQLVASELLLLEKCGVKVLWVRLPEDGGAPRYDFAFPSGELQYKTRMLLEAEHFDLGQEMQGDVLRFYASRCKQQSKGWEV